MKEIIIWQGEEETKELIKEAKKQGNKEIIVMYEQPGEKLITEPGTKNALYVKNPKEIKKGYDLYIGLGTRENIEHPKIKIITRAETIEKKDKTHRRGSGLNQVTAKLITEKNKEYSYDLTLLKEKNKEIILGRMIQNQKILKKYGAKTETHSYAKNALEIKRPLERKNFQKTILETFK